MKNSLNLIVMLTHNDETVNNAHEIFEKCKNSDAKFWGFKEKSIPIEQMKNLYKYMKECGKTTLGTVFFDSINEFCKKNNLRYMPFVGKVTERPSILEGEIDEIIKEANEYLKKGVYGFDLLGYRYTGNAVELNERFVLEVNAPVCIAGSVNGYERLDELKNINPWSFTIGSAFFENKFDGSFEEQINTVCEYVKQ